MKVAWNGVRKLMGNLQWGFKIQFFFQNSIVYYFFFIFLVFFKYFFLFHISILVKKFLKFLWCFIVWIRDLSKNSRFFSFKRKRDTTTVILTNHCNISLTSAKKWVYYSSLSRTKVISPIYYSCWPTFVVCPNFLQ